MTPCTIDDVKSYDSPKIYKRHDGWPPLEHARGHIIAELRAQNAALLAEVERLKARLTITDELLKTAARAAREAAGVNSKTMRNLREHYLDSWMTVTRAALLAAGMTDAALDAAEGEGK